MHAGSRIVRLERASAADSGGDEWAFSVLAKFEEHKSMNYGSDVQPIQASGRGEGRRVVVSTSFYDKLMCVWEV